MAKRFRLKLIEEKNIPKEIKDAESKVSSRHLAVGQCHLEPILSKEKDGSQYHESLVSLDLSYAKVQFVTI